MMKWIGRSIYALAILFLSVFVYRLAYTGRIQEYYETEIKENINDDETLLRGLTTSLAIDYYRETPVLYTYTSTEGDFRFNLNAYAVGISYGEDHYDGMMFVINDIELYEEGTLLDNPIIKMTVNLDEATLLVDGTYQDYGSVIFDPILQFSIYNIPALFLFNAPEYLLVPSDDETAEADYANISSIVLEYSNGETNDDGAYVFDETPFFVATNGTYSEAVHDDHKDTAFSIDSSLYELFDLFGDDGLTDDDISTYNLNTDHDDLTPYNGVIWRTMLIYGFSMTVITYFLFFHRHVRNHYKYKRKDPEKASQTAIFKDSEEDKN